MAVEPGENDSGSRDRATVALVDAKIDGLRELIRAEFSNVKEDVKALGAIVSDVIKQGITLEEHERRLRRLEDGNAGADHERRITSLEDGNKRSREYRSVHMPSIIIAGLAALISIGILVSQIVH